jgi:hypothetical protein
MAIQATRAGRPGLWTWDDVEAARLEANATARPRGETGPTPDELWSRRRPTTEAQRRSFVATVAAEQRGSAPEVAWPELWNDKDREVEDRAAVRRALQTCGYLLYPRRRIALLNRKRKVT